MIKQSFVHPVDYLIIGHITIDITPSGLQIGGTAAYAALTAKNLGFNVGIITSYGYEIPLTILEGIQIINHPTERSTTFENRQTPSGRKQYIHHKAPNLDINIIPDAWLNTRIVHFAPVAQEISPNFIRNFPHSFIGVTPQGWLREWDDKGQVSSTEWPEARFILEKTDATVISIEDVAHDDQRIEELASASKVLVVTEGSLGAIVYWYGDVRHIPVQPVSETDSTGAGDIFAAAFFFRLHSTQDPWESARFANQIARHSVTRPGLAGVPTPEEINNAMVEVL